MKKQQQQFDISIDHRLLIGAKQSFDSCLRSAVARAISTGSMEGSATLKVSFELKDDVDHDTGETFINPEIDFKSAYSVPLKDSIDGSVIDKCRIVPGSDGMYQLIAGQISMDELLEEEKK